jgi:hypothetical protein
MQTDSDSEKNAQERGEQSLPECQSHPEEPQMQVVESTSPPPEEYKVARDFHQKNSDQCRANYKKPIPIQIVENASFSRFEITTMLLGCLGVIVAMLSLFAACFVAYWAFRQLKDVDSQTQILNQSFEKQKTDSIASAESTAAQLKILQGQLAQQSEAMKLDQRAWVGFSGFSEIYKAATQGQHSAGSVIINTGKTPARSVNAIVFINERAASVYPSPADVSWMNNLITRAEDKGNLGSGGKFVDRIPHPKGFISLSGPVRLSIGTIASGEPQPLISIGRFAGETKKDNSDLYPRNVVVIFGKIEYWDVFGHPRKTIFCSQRSAGPEQPFGRCPIYNDME